MEIQTESKAHSQEGFLASVLKHTAQEGGGEEEDPESM